MKKKNFPLGQLSRLRGVVRCMEYEKPRWVYSTHAISKMKPHDDHTKEGAIDRIYYFKSWLCVSWHSPRNSINTMNVTYFLQVHCGASARRRRERGHLYLRYATRGGWYAMHERFSVWPKFNMRLTYWNGLLQYLETFHGRIRLCLGTDRPGVDSRWRISWGPWFYITIMEETRLKIRAGIILKRTLDCESPRGTPSVVPRSL